MLACYACDLDPYLTSVSAMGTSLNLDLEWLASQIDGHSKRFPCFLGWPTVDRSEIGLPDEPLILLLEQKLGTAPIRMAASLSGEENADEMRASNDGVRFLSNNNGGVAGGISTGQDVVVRIAIKPTSSILTPVQSVTRDGEEVDVRTVGRHDPCVGIRAVPVAEAMLACVLADARLRHRGQTGR